MNKIHVKEGDKWLPVFCHNGGKIITCENHPEKALPTLAGWATDDIEWFAKKFANREFSLRAITRSSNA
jgi:hypothetical protein